jgi:AcrR family transcriptional regulator
MQRTTRPYHHGQLREALVAAGFDLARKSGPDAVVLRAVSRATGVSHNAAYRHFVDHQDLLNAVADRCMRELADLMQRRVAEVRVRDAQRRARAEVRAIGRAYVEFALAEPGLFRTAFACVPVEGDDLPVDRPPEAAQPGPYELLSGALDRAVEVGLMAAERRPGAEYAAWSVVHGLSMLFVEGPLRALPAAEREHAIDIALDVVARGL